MTDLVVFYNVCDLPNSRALMLMQMSRFLRSELSKQAKLVYVMMNGDLTKFLDLAALLDKQPNVRMVHIDETCEKHEYPGLAFLKEYCDCTTSEQYIMYWHIKGVSHINNAGVQDWREYLEYWNIDCYKECVRLLDEGHDTCGTNWINQPFLGIDRAIRNWPHYSGNFWWARTSYIKRLDRLPLPSNYANGTRSRFTNYIVTDKNKYWRFDHEAWIGSGNPRAAEIHRSPGGNHDDQGNYPGWHYHHLYPESNYK